MSEAVLAPQLTAVPAATAAGASFAVAPSAGGTDDAGLFDGFLAAAMAGDNRSDRGSSRGDGSSRTLLSAVSAAPLLPERSDDEPVADAGDHDFTVTVGLASAAAPVSADAAPISSEGAGTVTTTTEGTAAAAQGSGPGAAQTLPDALAAVGTATAADPVLLDEATDATLAAAGASAKAASAANTAIAIDLVALGSAPAGGAATDEAGGTVAPASAVALAAPTDSESDEALAALAQRTLADSVDATSAGKAAGATAAPGTDRGFDAGAATASTAGTAQTVASRQAAPDRADIAFRMLLETTSAEVTVDATPADDFRAAAPQPARQAPPVTRADLAADLLDRVRNEQAAPQRAGEMAADDPAVTIARSTATRDTAGTALAAALLAGAADARTPATQAAQGGGGQGAAAAASTPDGDTTATKPADSGKAPTPPPSPAGGIAAAASSFVARIKAAVAERGDTVATVATTTTTGTGNTPAATTATAPALPQSFAATLGAAVGGQAGGSAGLSTAMAQIAAEISRRAAAGETRFQIRLDPAELGRVDVRLSLDDKGAARAVLSVERKETFDLISRDHRALERTLREAGYEVRDGSVQVSLKQNEGNGSGSAGSGGNNAFERFAQQQGQQGQGQRGNARAYDEHAAERSPDADTLSRTTAFLTRPAASGRVDIRI